MVPSFDQLAQRISPLHHLYPFSYHLHHLAQQLSPLQHINPDIVIQNCFYPLLSKANWFPLLFDAVSALVVTAGWFLVCSHYYFLETVALISIIFFAFAKHVDTGLPIVFKQHLHPYQLLLYSQLVFLSNDWVKNVPIESFSVKPNCYCVGS